MSENQSNNTASLTAAQKGTVHQRLSVTNSLLVLAVIISVTVNGWFAWNRHDQAEALPPVLVIDPYALQHAKKEALLASGISKFESIVAETEQFAITLNSVLNDYREAGYVVVNRNAVIASPERLDITETVAQRLNLSLVSR